MEKIEQVAYGNKLKKMIKKEVTTSFTMEHQSPNNGKVDVVAFKTSDVPLTSKIKSYLWKHFGISVAKGHGNTETTLVINMSELLPESFEKIDSEYLRVFPEGDRKKKEIVPVQKDDVKEDEEKNIDNISRCRLMTSSFLNAILSFNEKFSGLENKRTEFLNFVEDDGDKSNQIINCINDLVAINAEIALVWLIGDNSSVIRTGQELLVDFTKMLDGGKKLTKFGFCLPPSNGAITEEIKLRLCSVISTSTPNVTDMGEGVFEAKYMRASTVEKLQLLLSQMGWNTQAEGNILRILAGVKPVIEVKKETSKEEEVKTLPEQMPQSKHFISPRELSVSSGNISTAANESKPSIFRVLYRDKPEAIAKFKELHKDDSIWPSVPEEKKRNIIEILRTDMKNGPIENYVKHLLDSRNKVPHLLWDENEAVEELKIVVCSPEFTKCKKETQDLATSFLKKRLANDNLNGLIDDLLDLFK